jgi:hypothetical protein
MAVRQREEDRYCACYIDRVGRVDRYLDPFHIEVSLARIGSYILWPVRRVKNINFFASKCKQITSLIKYTTKMVRNYTSNDIDFVQPT